MSRFPELLMAPRVGKLRPNTGPLGVIGAIDEIRNTIADENDTSHAARAGRAVCRAVASTGLNQVPLNNRTGPGYICEPYWAQKAIDPPVESVPFTGGQCDGVSYDIRYNREVNPLSSDLSTTKLGPIVGFVQEACENSSGIQGTCDILVSSGGAVRNTIAFTPQGGQPSGWFITSVTRADGNPDTCGDPPSSSEPGPSNPGTPYGTPIQPDGPGTPTYIVNPPTVVDGDDYYFDVDVIGGDGEPVGEPVRFDPDGNPPVEPLPPPSEGDDVADGSPDGEVNEEPTIADNEVGIGYSWNLTDVPSHRGGIGAKEPRVYAENIGSLQLLLKSGTTGVYYSESIVLREARGSMLRRSSDERVIGISWYVKPSFGPIELKLLKVATEEN